MIRISIATLSALTVAGFAHGQIVDWDSTTAWSNGTSTGSYNSLSGAGAKFSAITPLTYNFGNGLTALVSASLDAGTEWQVNASVYGGTGWAPRVTGSGNYALGVKNGTTTTGGEFTLTFSQEVLLNSFTIGDIDTGGNVPDLVEVNSDSGKLSVFDVAATAPSFTSLSDTNLRFTVIGVNGVNEINFTESATSGWASINSGGISLKTLTISLENGTGNHGIWFGNLEVTAVPEPSTYGLLGAASLLALAAYRRSKKA